MTPNTKHRIADACRIVLAITFIFSGFTKTIDPWGTAIKITEYLNSFGFETLNQYRFGFSIWLCGAELMMGCMLLFKVRTPLISIFSLATMSFFTVLTFYMAGWGTVEDCGCFGDAVKLSAWETFFKNLVLWPLAFYVWWDARKGKVWPISRREYLTTLLIMCFAFGLGAYCYRHLPLIDFLPFKKGVNIYEAMHRSGPADDITLVYRDRTSGELHNFGIEDTEWYDTVRWEYVDRIETAEDDSDVSLREFAVFDSENDVTESIITDPGTVYMISAVRLEGVKPWCAERLGALVRAAGESGDRVVCLTASPLGEDTDSVRFADGPLVPVYNVDATTLITMLRAKAGVVVLQNGVIRDKFNCRDIKRQ